MLSGMGRNVQFYCERFGTSLYDAVTLVKKRKLLTDEEMIWRAYMIKELVMVHDGVYCLSSDEFFRGNVIALIFNLFVGWFFIF